MTTEVARHLGIPRQTLQMWCNDTRTLAGPSKRTLYRGHWIPLYTEEDVRRVAALRDERSAQRPAMQAGGPGRKRMWNEPEAADRNRRNNRAVYHGHRTEQLVIAGRTEEARVHSRLAEELRESLTRDADARRALIRASIYYEP